ncbi:UDP-N-acetylmuramate dehydrogenase [Candidatus Ferrigenium straubiae]|jgi:UDP-N-acetylmuramate dehydrogenase|uniref:UDP-N-acetylmuramate dehydrogenase n=1 Tax=Candidatus Ferrigenium straubiae TaxID=2919506 RepID=UPI003F4AA02E
MNMSEPAHFTIQGLRGELLRDEDMSRHVTWRAGGRAERVYRPADLADLQVFLRGLPADESLLAVGLGSNLLVRDGGLRGTVLLLHGALNELRLEGADIVYAQAGVAGAKLARFAASNQLGGAEFFAGIPGTLGGMLAMNAGCYGSETWQKVLHVQVLTRSGELIERAPQEYKIGYRHVTLRETGEEYFVATRLQFEKGDAGAARGEIRALMEKRNASQPLNLPNAGSVFRNPPGDHAARLIEQCGLKGKRIGGAEVSEKHANFIVNAGGATAADIENLIGEVRETVRQQTGIELHPEVRIIGETK